MSLIAEKLKHPVDTLEEVKKLQELVRTLEMQNLQLRNKQNTPTKRSASLEQELKSRSSRKISDTKAIVECNEEKNSVRDEYFDDLDVIKLSDIEMSDDESWLYESPKSSNEDRENSYDWLRKDVDDLENRQLQLAKNALLSKVTELGFVGNIDTRSFARSKKNNEVDKLSAEKHYTSRHWTSDIISSCHILEFASDVEEVARKQEESLRNSSPFGTPIRGTSPGSELVENSSFIVESSNHSDHSSSSESPYSSNVSLHKSDKLQRKLSGYRGSLPNLNQEPLSMRQSKIYSNGDNVKLQNQAISGRVTDTCLQSFKMPKKEVSLGRSLNQRPGFNTTPNASTSVPKIAERTQSGLTASSRASSGSRSAARSGIPMPSMLNKKLEDSWSEGCF